MAALVSGEKSNFQFILRLLNTNVDGKQKIMYALTKIKGVGRRYSNLVCKKADVDLNKRYALRAPPFKDQIHRRSKKPANILLMCSMPSALVTLPPKNSNVSLLSSKILPSTRSRHGSSIVSAILWMARIRRYWLMVWRVNCVKI